MKKVLFLLSCTFCAMSLSAANYYKMVNVEIAGTLSSLISTEEKGIVTHLTITGSIDARDVKCMRDDLGMLAVLDIGAANIVAYNGVAGTVAASTSYPAGEMPEYSFKYPVVSAGKYSLTTIVLPISISSIGRWAFAYCNALSGTVTIPNSVTAIGERSFFYCDNITGLTIGNSVVSIGESAFGLCSKVSGTLIIPSSVTTIGNDAFGSCSKLTGLTIGSSVATLGNFAFYSCSELTGNIVIPNSVITIGSNCFSTCLKVTGFTFGNSLLSIGEAAFNNCSGLIGTLTIPNSVTSIGMYAFTECRGITTLILGNSINSFPDACFNNCIGLKRIEVSRTVPATLSYGAFSGVNKATCVLKVPVGTLATYKAAVYWQDFMIIEEVGSKTISLPTAGKLSSLLTADEKSSITNLTITGKIDARDFKCMRDEMSVLSVLDISADTIQAFTGSGGTDPYFDVYPANEIPRYSFSNPNTMTGKNSLTSIKLPSTITSIGEAAFYKCSGWTGNLIIPDLVTSIGNSAFADCRGLNGNLTIGKNVISIGNGAFRDCNSLSGSLIIPSTVSTIGDGAFSGCSEFTGHLSVPNLVTSVGNSAFETCNKLTGLTLGSALTTIGSYAFQSCTGLIGNLIIPNSVTIIKDNGFSNCSGLTGLTLGNGLVTLGENAFYSCMGLTGLLTLPASLTSIGVYSFGDCSGLTELFIPGSLTSISNYAFKNCSALTKISVNRSTPASILANTFANVNKTTCSLVVPVGATTAYKSANYWKDFLNVTEKNFNTSINGISIDGIRIYASHSSIIIEGITKAEKISIFTLDGKLLKQIKSQGAKMTIEVPESGVYLVKVGERMEKIKM
ncbi:MAG: leucine-rich repeat domain-containing protein [Paludibacter sp.]